jgi:broad specificity phosphatase PhoE
MISTASVQEPLIVNTQNPGRTRFDLGAVGFFLCSLSLLVQGCVQHTTPPMTSVIVVRHAEKQSTGEDPGLTLEGEARSSRLLDLLLEADVTAVFASQYRRTQATVEPLATALGLEVEIVDARDTPALAARILTEHRGQVVVVAGHSNTVPEIVAALGADEPAPIEETEYGNLFLVSVPDSGKAAVVRLQF